MHSHTAAGTGLGGEEVGRSRWEGQEVKDLLPNEQLGQETPQLGPGSQGLHFVPIDA